MRVVNAIAVSIVLHIYPVIEHIASTELMTVISVHPFAILCLSCFAIKIARFRATEFFVDVAVKCEKRDAAFICKNDYKHKYS